MRNKIMDVVIELIQEIIYEQIEEPTEREVIKQNTLLIESGILDSFALLKLIEMIEARYNFIFNLETLYMEKFETPSSITDLIIEDIGITICKESIG
ncbi:MAG: phosphopantetheine-binding protein [Desulfobacterales bacterium]|jgi:acyl carrier protein|nr:phosphopantetheine-binding protein [Desulfobacterales bacterium]HHY31248.1 acyl carrier protein [Syntrophaceticus sp.]